MMVYWRGIWFESSSCHVSGLIWHFLIAVLVLKFAVHSNVWHRIIRVIIIIIIIIIITPWPQSASELYRSSDRRTSANLVPTFEDRGCHLVSATDAYDRIFGFLDRSRYIFFQVAPQLYSRGSVNPVPDPLLLRKSGGAGKRTRTSESVARNSDH
jgi:hypothetical protein